MKVVVPRSGNGNPNGKYHTDKECRNLPENPREITLDSAEKLQWEECKICSGKAKQGKPERIPLRRLVNQGKV